MTALADNQLKGTNMADSLEALEKELEQEQLEQTKPIPGFENLRYVGNDQIGYWACGGRDSAGNSGYYIRSSDGVPIHFGCMAHLRMWAFQWYKAAGMTVMLPASYGGNPTDEDSPPKEG